MCKILENYTVSNENWVIEHPEKLDRFTYFQTALNVITLLAVLILGKSVGVALYGEQHNFLNFLYLPLSYAIPLFACCALLQALACHIENAIQKAFANHYKDKRESAKPDSENYGSAKILSHLTNNASEELPPEFNAQTRLLYKKLTEKGLI